MSTPLHPFKTRTDRIMAALREKTPPNNNSETCLSPGGQKPKHNLSSAIENEENLYAHKLLDYSLDPDLRKKPPPNNNAETLFSSRCQKPEHNLSSSIENEENLYTHKFLDYSLDPDLRKKTPPNNNAETSFSPRCQKPEHNLSSAIENEENLYTHKFLDYSLDPDLRKKTPPNNNAETCFSPRCQKPEHNLSSAIENEENLYTHKFLDYSPDPDVIDRLFEQVESNIPINLQTNANTTQILLSSDLEIKCHSNLNGSTLNHPKTINNQTCDHNGQETNSFNEPESIVVNNEKYNKICDQYQSAKSLSEFEEDDDDSIKDPSFESPSSSSSSCSSDSLSPSSSDGEVNKKAKGQKRLIKSAFVCSDHTEEKEKSDKHPQKRIIKKKIQTSSDNEELPNAEQPHELIENIPTKKNTRKRQRNDASHQKTKAKICRNAGKEYVSSSKSKRVIPAKKIKDPCKENCVFKCRSKISEIQRIKIFTDYYNLSDINRKRDFLLKHMELMAPNTKLKENKRRPNYAFYFQTEIGVKMRVCKTFFKNTLDVNDRTILTVRNKTTSSGSLTEDMRGKHKNHKKLDEDTKKGIRTHINSIPRIESHYLRAQTSKEFIDASKCIADLYRDYKDLCESEGRPFGKYHMYADIFNEEFNISFFKPKKDQCSLCYQYKHANDQIKETLKKNFEDHQTEKKLSREEKASDRSKVSPTFAVACFDMQAVLPLPKGEISIFYYKSKVNVMNFTVTEIESEDACCYIWHEGEGGKGATEVSSCLFKYLEEKSNALNNEDLEFTFYSDNCGAQNKNKYLIALLMYAVQILKIKTIYHKYLIAGHTQNEGDGSHSTIEKELRKTIRSDPIYTPDQFVSAIRNSRKQKKPFAVKELTHKDFLDVKQLTADVGNNFEKNIENEQL